MSSSPPHPIHAIAGIFFFWATTGMAAAATDQAVLENGRKLVSEAKCEACHMSKVGGDGSTIYTRKDRRVAVRGKLLPQVERCNRELALGLFPDDEAAIAAYLNAAYYKFKDE
jgi:cytochrome c peroxidase